MSECPICGHKDGACKGTARDIVTVSGMQRRVGPQRVPKQKGSPRWAGRAGYVGEGTGKIEIYDPDLPNIRLVDEPIEEEPTPEVGDIPSPTEDAGSEAEPESVVPAADKGSASSKRRRKADA